MDAFFERAAKRYAAGNRRRTLRRAYLAAAGSLALAACLGIPATLAFLNDADSADNDMSIASNDIEIVERFPEDPAVIRPGSIEKAVTVANTGSGPSYIRCTAAFSTGDAHAYASIAFDELKWKRDDADGYYYFESVVEPGSATSPLFESVTIADAPENEYGDFEVIVYAESAQAIDPSTGNPYESAKAAFGALQSTREKGALHG